MKLNNIGTHRGAKFVKKQFGGVGSGRTEELLRQMREKQQNKIQVKKTKKR